MEETMVFYNEQHKQFFSENKSFAGKDVYALPVIYLLGLTEETRRNFNRIYDVKKNEIHIDQLNQGWQTGTTLKITRLAFNLFNGHAYENDEDYNNDKVSSKFAVDKLFCCNLAPFFFEAIKLRYPEYCKNMNLVRIPGTTVNEEFPPEFMRGKSAGIG